MKKYTIEWEPHLDWFEELPPAPEGWRGGVICEYDDGLLVVYVIGDDQSRWVKFWEHGSSNVHQFTDLTDEQVDAITEYGDALHTRLDAEAYNAAMAALDAIWADLLAAYVPEPVVATVTPKVTEKDWEF